MNDAINDSGDQAMSPPPPPPPPPAAARGSRRQLISRKGAAVAVASGLVVGGVAGGYMISQAATTASPSATAAPAAPGATDRPHGFADAGPAARTQDLQQVASVIGITATQLQTEMAAGKTIAAIATEHNATSAAVVGALVTSENKEIDARVAAGQLTAAEGATQKSQTQHRVTVLVNGTRPAGGPGGWRGGPPPNAPASSSN